MTGLVAYYTRFNMEKIKCYLYSGECWYTLWYVWFILVVAVLILICLAVWSYKFYKYRQRRRRLLRCNPPPLAIAPGPPGYNEPSHLPPPYEEVIKTRNLQPASTVIYNYPLRGPYERWDIPPQTPPLTEISM